MAENLTKIRAALAGAGHPVAIVGVTKKQSPEVIREGLAAGVGILANNYAQEGERLQARVAADPMAGDVEWHFIGHIQTRKVKYLQAYHLVQSLDRLEVAEKFNELLTTLQQDRAVLVEVNIGREPQKSGVLPEELDAFLEGLERFTRLRLRGLMAMPPPLLPSENRRPFFKEMSRIYQRHCGSRRFDVLSMGTSDDYLVAVQEGSNMVRLGTTLFGARP